jgi:hypothetical protein
MKINLTAQQIEILYAFKGMTEEFEINEDGEVFAFVDGYPIKLKPSTKEMLPSINDD